MKKFFIFWISQAFSQFGSAIVGFALAWYLARETGSATILSTAMLSNILPPVILGPFIGPFIDRWNRKKILIYSDLITALLTLLLAVAFWVGHAQIWHIYVIMALRAISGTFQGAAFAASIVGIVPKEHLVRANGLNRVISGLVMIAAPPCSAVLMDAASMPWVLSIDVFTAALAIFFLLPLAIPQPPRDTLSVKPNLIGDMVQSFRYIASWKGLLYLVILLSLFNFFGAPSSSLMPLFVTNYLGGDVIKMGWLGTSIGVGIIAGGLILGVWGGLKKRIVTCLIFVVIQAIAIMGLSLTDSGTFWLSVLTVFICGATQAFIIGPLTAVMQSVVPEDMQGRFFSLLSSVGAAMVPLGLLVTGPLADTFGVRLVFFISAIFIGLLPLTALFSRNLMNMENQKPGEHSTAKIPAQTAR
jgi:MFS transporter, DHA3 family, macrolide efflux protein